MKLKEYDNKLVYSKELDGRDYRFKFNPKMVKILSDGIYSDKIGAIIRELSINACESHKIKGISTPISVHLPNHLEPYFSVEDFGIGLTEKEVYDIWCVYGESTKEKSNEFTGCLGLGSKTPFCYNKRSCTLQARKDGREVSFISHLGEDGIPLIELLGEKECHTDGLKITIPVNKNDIQEFYNKALSLYTYFDVLPTILGVDNKDFKKKEYLLRNGCWGIGKNSSYSYNHYNIVMGQICYPVKNDLICNHWGYYNTIDVYVDIGSVDIEASREGLSYDEDTKKFVINKIKEVEKEIKKYALEELKTHKNKYEACKFLGNTYLSKFISYPVHFKAYELKNNLIELDGEYITYDFVLKRGKIKYLESKNYFFVEDNVESCKLKRLEKIIKHGQIAVLVPSDKLKDFKERVDIDDSYFVSLANVDYKITRGPRVQKADNVNLFNGCTSKACYAWDKVDLNIVDKKEKAYYVLINKNNFKRDDMFYEPSYLNHIKSYLNVQKIYGIKEKHSNKVLPVWQDLIESLKKKAEKDRIQEIVHNSTNYRYNHSFQILDVIRSYKKDIKSQYVLDLLDKTEVISKDLKNTNNSYTTINSILPAKKFDIVKVDELVTKFPLLVANWTNKIIDELIYYINSKGI